MRCPFCGHDDTQVKDSRPTEDNSAIRRRRFCPGCGARFTTFERVQLREPGADERDCTDHLSKDGWFLRQGNADVALAEKRTETRSEDRHGETRGHLVGLEPECQYGEDESERGTGHATDSNAKPEVPRCMRSREGCYRAGQHHSLDAEIENPRLLDDELSEGGVNERRTGDQGRDQNGG